MSLLLLSLLLLWGTKNFQLYYRSISDAESTQTEDEEVHNECNFPRGRILAIDHVFRLSQYSRRIIIHSGLVGGGETQYHITVNCNHHHHHRHHHFCRILLNTRSTNL